MNNNKVFSIIRNQIVFNETQKLRGNETKNEFTVKYRYPEKAIIWMTQKAKAFKVAKVTEGYDDNGTRTYTIEYKDINTYSPFLEQRYSIEADKIEEYMRNHEFDHLPVVEKALAYNDKYRYELECPNYEHANKERIDKADCCSFELNLQQMGYESYKDFVRKNFIESYEAQTELELMHKDFIERNIEENIYENGYIY